ncbi:extracellular catalytic domain type 1 short-chain-length polyhydroxyalkanoate depolymerase [Caballeronia insecticola]|uniref:Esterase PHB depolymerase family n=1 Tax=Caballeronia insecticola TaxID=758793 RepID=R4WR28_9BURK|nr:PHB depolymerase family esterase [Caballeronia insecticola]BAN27138.1 esterase PHB depolymerase family [Caballeronia insecticola]
MKLNDGFLDSMKEAFARFREHDATGATDVIQRALRGGSPAAEPAQEASRPEQSISARLADVLQRFSHARPEQTAHDVEDRGHFSTRSYANAAGQRDYKLYVPSGYDSEPLPLIVMLHGCTQDADDFAAGTQMNALAEEHNCIVVYPVQPQHANTSKCWNWFKTTDQARDGGEPSLIAGITREVIESHCVDTKRVYIAGLSAGGAMAAIMAQRYPDLYAAAGVHSGLPAGSAHDLPSALAAMRGGKSPTPARATEKPRCPLIVFHGDADATVHYSNARELMRAYGEDMTARDQPSAGLAGARKYTVRQTTSPDGVIAELWTVHGAPHAWSGGSTRGSFTDPAGPNASAEMLRFFLAHPQRH